jgi:ligand-binding SRPBCC domain-containing protein
LEDIILKVFVYCSGIDAPSNEVFAWHCRDDAFEILDPPWWRQPFIVKERKGGGGIDTSNDYMDCKAYRLIVGKQFRDIQISGPFSSWSP